MKVQKFYPRQVLRKLQGEHKALDAGQLAAVNYGVRESRKIGLSLKVSSSATATDLIAAMSYEQAQAIIANATTRIFLKGAA